jgi:hypothetical protein
MRLSRPLYLAFIGVLLLLLASTFLPSVFGPVSVNAQVPAVDTPTEEPTIPAPTDTPTPTLEPPATDTPTPTATFGGPGIATPTNTPVPPVSIPEPITVVLFGTGLAALSAAAASRRKKQE